MPLTPARVWAAMDGSAARETGHVRIRIRPAHHRRGGGRGARRRGGAGARRRPDADPDAASSASPARRRWSASPASPASRASPCAAAELAIGGGTTHADRRARGRDVLPRARGARRPHRRPGGAEPRHDRRQPRQQRSLRRLPGGGARLRRHHRHRPRARSRPTTSSRASSPPRSSPARSSPRSASRSRSGPTTRSSCQPASRFALVGVFVAKSAGGVRVAVTGASEDGVFRWTEAEAALAADFRPEARQGPEAPPPTG